MLEVLLMSKHENIQEFEATPIGRKCRNRRIVLYSLAASIGCTTAVASVVGKLGLNWPDSIVLATVISGALVTTTVALAGAFQYNHELTHFVPERAIEEQAKLEEDRLTELKDTSLPAMLKFNRDQMVLYHTIATTQARVAGRNSQVAIALGFVLLVAGALVAIISPDVTTKIVTAGLASLGGIFSGYITKTFFVAQDRAIQQLYSYWQQPLTTSYLLAAERLAAQASSEALRDDHLSQCLAQTLKIVVSEPTNPLPNVQDESSNPSRTRTQVGKATTSSASSNPASGSENNH
jgi:hypothetical protein